MESRKTTLNNVHIEAGAKMVPFAGYLMPVRYTTIQEEHMAVRSTAGLFDVSHMGEFILKGSNALELLQRVSSNDASKLISGQAQYSCLPNESGGIVDDMIVYCIANDPDYQEFILVVNASNIQKDWNWIQNYNTDGVEMIDTSDETGLLALQGPNAQSILQPLTDVDLSSIKFYHFKVGQVGQIPDVIISATGYTGSGGFELYVENQYLHDLWSMLMSNGKKDGLLPAGLGARDTLRLEMGYCLYGNDIDEDTSPLAAGLSWIVKTQKEHFNSIDIFRAQKKDGVSRKLVGLKLNDRRIPRKGYQVLNGQEEVIGVVTSGSMSPMLKHPIAMAYVNKAESKIDTEVYIQTGRRNLEAIVCKPPFVNLN